MQQQQQQQQQQPSSSRAGSHSKAVDRGGAARGQRQEGVGMARGRGAGGRQDALAAAALAAQLRVMRSVLLERVELAEEVQRSTAGQLQAAQARGEAAAMKVAALRSQYDVLKADYERVAMRHEADKQSMSQKVRVEVLGRLLPLMDNFERAAASLPSHTEGERAVHTSHQQVYAALQQLLREAGIEEVPGVSSLFNPQVHDAIMREYDGEVEDGTVLAVLQKGYAAGEQLLRPALVKVSMRA
ncbi:GrpE-domain-containing protein [Haematococcus lacustris]